MTDLESFDPFADTSSASAAPDIAGAENAAPDATPSSKGLVHIRLQQRNGRKCLTTVQGLNEKLDLGKLSKAFKKEFCCNGCVVDDEELGRVIQLQGDQREKVKRFLVEEEIAEKKRIKVHGI